MCKTKVHTPLRFCLVCLHLFDFVIGFLCNINATCSRVQLLNFVFLTLKQSRFYLTQVKRTNSFKDSVKKNGQGLLRVDSLTYANSRRISLRNFLADRAYLCFRNWKPIDANWLWHQRKSARPPARADFEVGEGDSLKKEKEVLDMYKDFRR